MGLSAETIQRNHEWTRISTNFKQEERKDREGKQTVANFAIFL